MMTVDEAFQRATSELDAMIALTLENTEALMRAHNATELEIEETLAIAKAEQAEWRAAQLPKLRAWIGRGGEELH